MISPFTGGKAVLEREQTETQYRGEVFSYTRYYYRCVDTNLTFTDSETDEKSLRQVYDEYRRKYGIPAPEKMKEIREKYHLSAIAMSKILGIGDNQYGLYENGEMPVKNVGRVISLMEDKNIFLLYLDLAKNQFSAEEYDKILKKIEGCETPAIYSYIYKTYAEFHGFSIKTPSVVYFGNKKDRWNTVKDAKGFAMA